MSQTWHLNGKWVVGAPFLSANDAGLMCGAMVTDRLRTIRHAPYQLQEHIERFRRSCWSAHVPIHASDQDIVDVIQQLVDRNPSHFEAVDDFAIVLLATPGPIDGLGPPTFIAHLLPLDFARYRPMFERGAHLRVASSTGQVSDSVLSRHIKHRSRLNWWIAQQEVRAADSISDAVLLDNNGLITETASANIIVVKGGELYSPLFASILPGISMRMLRSISQDIGHKFYERNLTTEDCLLADEILLTNSSWCLAGVSRFNGQSIPWPGPIYTKLSEAWKEQVGLDYVEQILQASS